MALPLHGCIQEEAWCSKVLKTLNCFALLEATQGVGAPGCSEREQSWESPTGRDGDGWPCRSGSQHSHPWLLILAKQQEQLLGKIEMSLFPEIFYFLDFQNLIPPMVVLGVFFDVGSPGFPDSGGAGLLSVETNWFYSFAFQTLKGSCWSSRVNLKKLS